MPSPQFVLNFEHRPALGAEDLLVAPGNADAVAWLDRWPDWPTRALVLYGPTGCGKSHLAQVFQAMTNAAAITFDQLMEVDPPTLLAGADACLLDDADLGLDGPDRRRREVALLHLYNTALESGARIMMTGRTPPSRWGVSLADLSSRLKTAAVAEIGPPDDAVLAAVLVKQFADRQLKIDAEVVAFTQTRIERSFAAIGRLVAAADRLAMAEKRRITVPLIKRALSLMNE